MAAEAAAAPEGGTNGGGGGNFQDLAGDFIHFRSILFPPLPSSLPTYGGDGGAASRGERDVEERREGERGRRFDQVFSIFFSKKKKLKGGGGRTWSVCSRAPGDGMRGSLAS